MSETIETPDGKRAQLYGFKIENHSNHLDSILSTPEGYSEYPNAIQKLRKLFPKADGIMVFGNGKDTLVRISNEGFYTELSIEDKYLGKKNNEGLNAVKNFHEKALKILKTAKIALGDLNNDIIQSA